MNRKAITTDDARAVLTVAGIVPERAYSDLSTASRTALAAQMDARRWRAPKSATTRALKVEAFHAHIVKTFKGK